jgi:hypothetical protein
VGQHNGAVRAGAKEIISTPQHLEEIVMAADLYDLVMWAQRKSPPMDAHAIREKARKTQSHSCGESSAAYGRVLQHGCLMSMPQSVAKVHEHRDLDVGKDRGHPVTDLLRTR